MPEPGAGGPLASPIFCRSVNPIRTGEGRLSPPITIAPPHVFHLPASLDYLVKLSSIFTKNGNLDWKMFIGLIKELNVLRILSLVLITYLEWQR